MELVYMDGKKEPYTTSEIVAECAGVQHHTVTRLLRNHKERFEAFGFYGFEIHKLDGKGASGMNKRQLMAARGGYNGIDSLTSTELARYQDLEDMAIAMINLGMTYQEIKSMVFRPQQGG